MKQPSGLQRSDSQTSSLRTHTGPSYDGRRVVGAMLAGTGIGLLIAFFMKTTIDQSSVTLPPRRIFWLFLIASGSGGLTGLAVESMRQLQASNPDPAYRRGGKARIRGDHEP